ncbi:MAG: glycosyltransferase family 39 protein [Methanobacteriaceae archaeon]|nr:glycosyltransferase family 39 protein [Methanobacteriaceae archaeon]
MNYSLLTQKRHFLLLIPALAALIIALIPTLKYQWPLSWDIYYHVHISKLYLAQGFTFWDSLTYAPYGRPIFYPPLFHYLLALISIIFHGDLFQVSRYLQPVFAFLLVLSFTCVAKEFYNLKIGILVGFFLFFTSVFHRAMLPIPETMALIFFPLAVYLYYRALEGKGSKYAVIAGIISGLMMLTHNLTALIMLGVVLLFTLALKIRKEKVDYKSLWIFLGFTLLVASIWWLPLIIQHGFVFNNPQTIIEGPVEYLIILGKTVGVPGIIFAILWSFIQFRKKNSDKVHELYCKDVLMIIWVLFLLVLSNVYLLGVSILIDRILNFLVFPVMVMAALGLESIKDLNGKKQVYDKLHRVLVVLLILGAVISGLNYAISVKPLVNDSQRDLAQWFAENGDKKGVVMSLTEGIDPVIVSISRQPVSTGGYQPGMVKVLDRDLYYSGTYTKEDVRRDKIKYFVESSPIPHQSYFTLVYQNKDYKVWRVDI